MVHGIFTINKPRAFAEVAPVLNGIPAGRLREQIMRPDMHKVICERPRSGGGWDRPRWKNTPLDLLPHYEPMCRVRRGKEKEFGENLAPLRRWLVAQVGRSWNEVYSEACQVIKPDSVVRNHIKFHLLGMVERHTFLKDGEVCCLAGDGWPGNVAPIASWHGMLYVNPTTGVLCLTPSREHDSPRIALIRRQMTPVRSQNYRWVNDSTAYLQCKGCWFECEMRPITQENQLQEFDLAQRRRLSRMDAEQIYGKPVFCTAKRQLSRKELREHGLTNEAFAARSDQSLAA